MSNVIGLKGAVPPGEPVSEIVEQLERLLVEAKAGKIRGHAFAVTYVDMAASSEYFYAAGERFNLAAAIMTLHTRMAHALAYGEN